MVNQLAAALLGTPADLVLLYLLFYMSKQTFLAEKMGAAERVEVGFGGVEAADAAILLAVFFVL